MCRHALLTGTRISNDARRCAVKHQDFIPSIECRIWALHDGHHVAVVCFNDVLVTCLLCCVRLNCRTSQRSGNCSHDRTSSMISSRAS